MDYFFSIIDKLSRDESISKEKRLLLAQMWLWRQVWLIDPEGHRLCYHLQFVLSEKNSPISTLVLSCIVQEILNNLRFNLNTFKNENYFRNILPTPWETLKLNIWRRKARWPNGSLETLEKLEGGVAVRKMQRVAFPGAESTSPCHSPCALCRSRRVIRSHPSLGVGDHAQKRWWSLLWCPTQSSGTVWQTPKQPFNGHMSLTFQAILFNRSQD